MYVQIWNTEKKNNIFIISRGGGPIITFFLDYVLDKWEKICYWKHSLKQVHFNLGEFFPQPKLSWKDTQYR